MKDKRQGNDLKVAWSIFKQDREPFRLEGLNVSLYLKSMFGRKPLNDFVITGNIIQWTFYGKDQKSSGKYSLEMVVNEGEKGMITTDACDFVNLVSCSCQLEGGKDEDGVETDTIVLESRVDVASGEVVTIVVDEVLSETSVNPVQNRVITAELNKKAYKSEIPTKMSQLEQDIEIGGEVDLSEYPTREEVSETYLPREEFEERIEGYATYDTVQELSDNVTELSSQVGGLSERVDALGEGAEQEVFWATEGITDASKGTTYDEILAAHNAGKVVKCLYQKIIFDLRYVTNILYFAANVNNNLYYLKCPQSNRWQFSTENTEHKLETLENGNAKITIAGKTAEVATPKEWKCVYDGRMEVGQMQIESTTYADGTPLDAEELVVQVIMESSEGVTQPRQGYVEINSSLNKNKEQYGAIYFEKPSLTNPAISMIRLKASPFIMVADVLDAAPIAVAQGGNLLARAGRYGQIYENISYVRVYSTQAIQAIPPIIKIYAR